MENEISLRLIRQIHSKDLDPYSKDKMNPRVIEILKIFGREASRIQKPSDAMLAQVYLVDDRYILRSRPYEEDTAVRFAAEYELCKQVAALTGFRFPEYLRSTAGNHYVVDDNYFWTLHRIIPGRPLGSWFELHRIEPSVHREVLNTLHRLHTVTKGCFEEKMIDRKRLLDLVAPAMAEADAFLRGHALERLKSAFDSVSSYCGSYPPEASGFVHGDFHHGNILARDGRIVGFIDLVLDPFLFNLVDIRLQPEALLVALLQALLFFFQ